MELNKNILVFPCGSEVGLEIHRSLEHSIHFNLIGGNSVDDHGKFVYQNYIGDIPFITDPDFITILKKIVADRQVDAIYPATDATITLMKQHEAELACKVISSPLETVEMCQSKSKTYQLLSGVVPTPGIYYNVDSISQYPVFLKPDEGYGSRGVKKANNADEAINHLSQNPACIILEYLPGKEYTVDCFSDAAGQLLFVGQRERKRISNGISVNTSTVPATSLFGDMASRINNAMRFTGAWFFQVKENAVGQLVLMEVASRMGGSSGAYRAKGVNFAALSLYSAFGIPVSVDTNNYEVELDRALVARYKTTGLQFDHVYIDFDDTLIVRGMVNLQLIYALYNLLNQGKKLYLITKHKEDIYTSLKKHRLQSLFDEVIHLKKEDIKWEFMQHQPAIFIDDSFAERKQVKDNLGIPVFSTDMVEIFWQLA